MSTIIQLTKFINRDRLIDEFSAAGFTRITIRGMELEVLDSNNDEPEVFAIYDAHDQTPIIPTEQVFDLPIVAPSVTAGDYFVQSPKPKANHLEAHAEAIAESKKQNKSLALMVLDMVVYIEELEKRIKALEKK